MSHMGDMADRPVDALLPGRVGLFVRLECAEGNRPAILDVLNRYVDGLDSEPGTEVFLLALDPEDEGVVWLFEWFTDEAGLEAHRESPMFAEMMAEMPPLLVQPPGILRIDPLRLHMRTSVLAASDNL